jgi:two-component system response regulator AtoC
MSVADEARRIFIVDDEPDILESLRAVFASRGYEAMTAASGEEALRLFADRPVPVVVCDLVLPDLPGTELLTRFRDILPEVQMIMVTGKGTIDAAVGAMKAGVFDFITKPVNPEHLLEMTNRAEQLYTALSERRDLIEQMDQLTERHFVGSHPSVKKLLRLVGTVAPSESAVLIEGESGTGKEVVARLIHRRSKRSGGPFVAVDCGAIPEGLVESELFGYEKGAFTGAMSSRPGKFEQAHRGTLFLDEIGNLPLLSQAKLLRSLQESAIQRLGGRREVPVDIRLIAAANQPLRDAVREGRFREDLFYRLNIVTIRVPPLRERKSDILALAMHFVQKHREKAGGSASGVTKDALKVLMGHTWPGNVRELENAIEHALIMASGKQIQAYDLPPLGDEDGGEGPSRLDEAEKDLLEKALRESGGNKYQAARMLGIPRSSLYSKLKKYGLSRT